MRPRVSAFVATVALVLLGALVPLVGACARPAASPSPSTRAAASDDEWRGETWEERHDTMTFTVLPNMGRLFQRFAREDAPSLTCRSCHGADAEARAYKMPASLPALDEKNPMATSSEDEARIARFMADEVTPTFSELIGAPATCFSCHPRSRP